jgi:hypothetical protein
MEDPDEKAQALVRMVSVATLLWTGAAFVQDCR